MVTETFKKLTWKEDPPSPLPSWFDHQPPADEPEQLVQQQDPLEQYKERLHAVKKLEELKQLWAEPRIADQNPSVLSRMAFEHVCERGLFHEALDFLKDSELNVPEALNLSSLVIRSSVSGLDRTRYRNAIHLIGEALTLGIVSDSEVRTIVGGLPLLVEACFPEKSEQNAALAQAYENILDSLSLSEVRPLKTVDPSVLHLLVERCLALPDYALPPPLRMRIVTLFWPLEKIRVDAGIDDYLASWARRLGFDMPLLSPLTGKVFSADDLVGILNKLSPGIARSFVVSATMIIMNWNPPKAENKALCNITLNCWLTCLQRSVHGSKNTSDGRSLITDVYATLAAMVDSKTIAMHLSELPTTTAAAIILKHWLWQHMERQPWRIAGSDLTSDGLKATLQTFKDNFRHAIKGRGLMPFIHIMLACIQCRVYAKPVQQELFQVICKMYGPYSLLCLVRKLRNRRVFIYPEVLAPLLQEFCLEDPITAWRLFLRVPALRLSYCSKLPIALARGALTYPEKILKLLERRDGWTEAQQAQGAEFQIHLLHALALEFAYQQKHSAQLAFKNVYRCYMELRSRKAQLRPLLSRAIVHAGVTRCMLSGHWLSTIKFRWIVKIVRQIEGDQVANELDALAWDWRQVHTARQLKLVNEQRARKKCYTGHSH